jgi:peptidoglycan/xylan/chitin deacetylase (PgdA/CDA1 family)
MTFDVLARKATKVAALPFGVTRRHDDDLVVLLYHRVGTGTSEIDLPLSLFEQHLSGLAHGGRVVSLECAMRTRTPGVVISFDDGFRDFHEHVVPLLIQHGLPAVLYLATGSVGDGSGSPSDALTWTHLEEAVATGLVTVGSHTHSHADLSHADVAVAEQEMRRSKGVIEHHLGRECRHFAFPWAVASHSAQQVAARIFDSVALDAWRTNSIGQMDFHRMGRTPVLRSDGRLFFQAKLRGLLDGEAAFYRALGRGPWSKR